MVFANLLSMIENGSSKTELMERLNDQKETHSKEAIAAATEAFTKLKSMVNCPETKVEKQVQRGYIDGAFDLVHSGHFNAIRQAHALCDELVIGANSDEDIRKVKGPTVFND